jgi:hypothetical protein
LRRSGSYKYTPIPEKTRGMPCRKVDHGHPGEKKRYFSAGGRSRERLADPHKGGFSCWQ